MRSFFGVRFSPLKPFSVFDLFLRRFFGEDSGMSWGGGMQGEDDVEAGWRGDEDSDILVSRSIWVLLRRASLLSSPLSIVETTGFGVCSPSMSMRCPEKEEGVDEEDVNGR